jgi:D-glycero-D-manno-heptose 1,7-bisphosphate phosphatase
MRPALFLDRDGVINVDKGYVHRIEDWEWRPGIFDVIRGFRALGHLVIVVTNQSGIGRGIFSDGDLRHLTEWMDAELERFGASIDGFYFCPHVPRDNCDCRKPASGMILRAAKWNNIDLAASTLIGDRETDIEAGRAAGVGHLILWKQGQQQTGLGFTPIK